VSGSGTRCLLSVPSRFGCFLRRETASVVCSFERSCRKGNRSSQASDIASTVSAGGRGLLRVDVEVWSSSGTDVGFVGLSIDRRREERDSDDDGDDA
jgi:hypothetical protein